MATIEKDGYLVDDETGEFLGYIDPKPAFCVTDQDSAEWVLAKFSENEAERVGLLRRRDAIIANIDRIISGVDARAGWLTARFEAELQRFTLTQIADKKQKYHDTAYGRMQFRTTPGRTEIVDKEAAVEWAEINAPEAVKIDKRVLVTGLKGIELPEDIFTIVPPSEKFSFDTGIKA